MSIVVNGTTAKNVVFNGKDVKKVCNEADKIIFTNTFGKVWKVGNCPYFSSACSFCVFGNGVFLVVAFSGSYLYRSTDGVNWNCVDGFYASKLYYANGYFFAINSKGLYKSEDGITWTLIINKKCCSVIYAKGYWITGYDGILLYSNDCNTWETKSLISMSKGDILLCVNNIIYHVLESGNVRYLNDDFSENFITINGSQTTYYAINNILYEKGVFVGVSSYMKDDYPPKVFYSEDGLNWNMGNLSSTKVRKLRFFNNCFFVFENGQVYKSEDGMNWTLCIDGLYIDDIFYEKGVYIAFRSINEKKPLYSCDCENWIESEIVTNNRYIEFYNTFAYGKDRIVCVPGSYSNAYRSEIIYSE